jgi:hypothetical protein
MQIPPSLRYLSILALVEGASLIALVGMTHGALFLLATATLAWVLSRGHLPASKGTSVFAASLIPFAGVWSHRMLVRSIKEWG